MFAKLFNFLFGKKAPPAPTIIAAARGGLFSHEYVLNKWRGKEFTGVNMPELKRLPRPDAGTVGMDDFDTGGLTKPNLGLFSTPINEAQLVWYAEKGFIGYQMCALLAQHWMIDKACSMPGKDAVRKGYDIKIAGGVEVSPEVMEAIRNYDKAFKIKQNVREFIRHSRIFGIRIALFVVDSDDPNYYSYPFNIDGVKPGSYRGISQIDPYWITPELSANSALRPGDIDFYEPDFWRVDGKLIHKSHLIILTTGSVPDVLKPSYLYGGVSIPQRIYERVYAAEMTANEAPQLAATKRLTVYKTDLEEAIGDDVKFTERMSWWAQTRDNYGVKISGSEDTIEQFDLSLADLDNTIMTQYQLIATIAEVPGTKLLGTQPRGFNSTGEFEESSYHESLETIQEDVTPLINRHHALVVKSYIMPIYLTEQFRIDVAWNPLDAMTATEQASVNLQKAELGAALIATGTIQNTDENNRIRNDPNSGYSGIAPVPVRPPAPAAAPGAPAAAPGGGQTAVEAAAAAIAPKPNLPRPKPELGA